MPDKKELLIREAVAVFDQVWMMQRAIDELLSSGFNRADLSFVATEHAIEEKLGHIYKKAEQLEDDPLVPRAAYVATESVDEAQGALIGTPLYIAAVTMAGIMVAGGGPLALTLAAVAAAGGAGAVIGVALSAMVEAHHADYLQEQLDRGGFLLWVRTTDPAHEKRATEILSKHSAHDVHVHGRSAADA
jgi:hypothetical protein